MIERSELSLNPSMRMKIHFPHIEISHLSEKDPEVPLRSI